jgi:enediyne biosynthesis protein E4
VAPHRDRRRRLLASWAAIAALSLTLALMPAVLTRDLGYETWDPAASATGVTDVMARTVGSEDATFRFEEVTERSGIEFRHFPGIRANLLPEDMGSGLAWGDYNDSGYPDLFLVNIEGPLHGPPGGGRCTLYRNEGDGTFTDVTMESRLDCRGIGMAAAWADYNDNGHLDLFVSRFGSNLLYRNNGDGTFSDVTEEAGVGGNGSFSAGAVWGDYDADGHLDLYVANYVSFAYSPGDERDTRALHGTEIPFTLNPAAYPPQQNYLYRNNGDGTFTEVALEAGVANPAGRSLGAVWADFSGNGLADLYVANDISENAMFLNRGDGTFEDAGARSLTADYRGSMGLAVVDHDGDGALDLFITNWLAERNTFFRNTLARNSSSSRNGSGPTFLEMADHLGLGAPSLAMVGWATGFVDFDNDGLPDLWVVNGHTFPRTDDPTRLRPQPMQFFRQLPGSGFSEVSLGAWEGAATPIVGRGGAHADFDRDGRVDLAIGVHGGRPILLRNVTPDPGHWVVVRLRQSDRNTRAVGARVTVRAGDRSRTDVVGATPSYLSQSPLELHFGLGEASRIDEMTIEWPDGCVESLHDMEVDTVLTLHHQPDRHGVRPTG